MTRPMNLAVLVGTVLFLDQVSKLLILHWEPSIDGELLWLGIHWNKGLMLGALGGHEWPLVSLAIFVLVIVASVAGGRYARGASMREMCGWALFVGGGLSNIVDRLVHEGAVLDWIQVQLGPVQSGRFNIADLANLVGLGLILVMLFQEQRQQPERS